MAETETPTPAPEQPAQPTVDERLAAQQAEVNQLIAAERARADKAIQEANYMAGQQAEAARQQAQTPRVDPLDQYAKEGISLPADQQKALLDQSMRLRARSENDQLRQHMERRIAEAAATTEANVALQQVLSANPDITSKPENEDRFKAAMLFAREQARRLGQELSPGEIANRAAAEFRRQQRPSATPHIEGGSRPDLAQAPAPAESEPPAFLRKAFGKKLLDLVKPLTDPETQMAELTREYVHGKNTGFFKKGLSSEIGAVMAAGEEQ